MSWGSRRTSRWRRRRITAGSPILASASTDRKPSGRGRVTAARRPAHQPPGRESGDHPHGAGALEYEAGEPARRLLDAARARDELPVAGVAKAQIDHAALRGAEGDPVGPQGDE